MNFSREFAMPSSETFSLPPVSRLLDKWLADAELIVDPFARESTRGTLRNDLDENIVCQHHMDAGDFVEYLQGHKVRANVVLFDPPYSPRQISECYRRVGRAATKQDTQNARLYKTVKDGLDALLLPGGIAICCGWNSVGFGKKRGYELLEVLLVPHGAAHNDTIVTVERKGE